MIDIGGRRVCGLGMAGGGGWGGKEGGDEEGARMLRLRPLGFEIGGFCGVYVC